MFACAQYAVPPAFLASSAKEIADNVKRLQSHPSIAMSSHRSLYRIPSHVEKRHVLQHALLSALHVTGAGLGTGGQGRRQRHDQWSGAGGRGPA